MPILSTVSLTEFIGCFYNFKNYVETFRATHRLERAILFVLIVILKLKSFFASNLVYSPVAEQKINQSELCCATM